MPHKPSLFAQAQAVSTASQYAGRAPPRMRESEAELHKRNLGAAFVTLTLIQASYDRLKADAPWFIADIEGGE